MIKKYAYEISIILFVVLLMLCILPLGSIFGSETDWFNQHVSIAEQIRQACYSQLTLLPDYSTLGGGSNFFMFAYYGVLRFDILLSLLLPFIAMQDILIAYSIVCIFASALLSFHFLKKQGITTNVAFISTLLLACASCFFQAHRQLMFINYMPYLFLLLLSVDARKKVWISLSFVALFIHSFFFSVSFLFVGLLYSQYKQYSIKQYMISFILACGIASCLLLPSALAILEQHKDAGSTDLISLFGMQYSYENMLYNQYGCGLTLISLYSVLACIKAKKARLLSILILIIFSFSIFSFLLNGTLYIRSKIYIPFLPLLILCIATTLDRIYKRESNIDYRIIIALFLILFAQSDQLIYCIDLLLIITFLLLYKRKARIYLFGILLLVPIYSYIQVNRSENFIAQDDQRKTIFDDETLSSFYQDSQYRFDIANHPLTNANHSPITAMKKSTMYSSTMNSLYSTFYYDLMKTPISIKNRVALLANPNPFLTKLMSVRYLQTKKEIVPSTYEIKKEKKDYILAKNENVLPIAYVSSSLISNEQFQQLSFPYTLDTIANNSVVKQNISSSYTSQITPFKNESFEGNWRKQLQWNEDKKAYIVENKQKKTVSLPIETLPKDTLLIIKMEINNTNKKEVTIDINKIRNRLSADNANYPNQHYEFVYYVSNSDNTLTTTLSKGQYTISSISMYTIPVAALNQMEVNPLHLQETKDKEIIKGEVAVKEDGYFITSLPYQKGYRAYVDKKEIDIEIVNTAFVGFPMESGQHKITIVFEAPGKKTGILMSLLSCIILCYITRHEERKKKDERMDEICM